MSGETETATFPLAGKATFYAAIPGKLADDQIEAISALIKQLADALDAKDARIAELELAHDRLHRDLGDAMALGDVIRCRDCSRLHHSGYQCHHCRMKTNP